MTLGGRSAMTTTKGMTFACRLAGQLAGQSEILELHNLLIKAFWGDG